MLYICVVCDNLVEEIALYSEVLCCLPCYQMNGQSLRVEEKVNFDNYANFDIFDNSGNFEHCPHCGTAIEIVEVACGIFRCGAGVPQHATESEVEAMRRAGKIYGGCGKQFRINNQGHLEKCTGY